MTAHVPWRQKRGGPFVERTEGPTFEGGKLHAGHTVAVQPEHRAKPRRKPVLQPTAPQMPAAAAVSNAGPATLPAKKPDAAGQDAKVDNAVANVVKKAARR